MSVWICKKDLYSSTGDTLVCKKGWPYKIKDNTNIRPPFLFPFQVKSDLKYWDLAVWTLEKHFRRFT